MKINTKFKVAHYQKYMNAKERRENGRKGGLKGGLATGPRKARTTEQARAAALARWARVRAAKIQPETKTPLPDRN